MSELQYWVWLSERLRLRPKRKLELLEAFGDVRRLYFALEADYRAALGALTPGELRDLGDKDLTAANAALDALERNNLSMLTVRDAAYPERLRQIFDPPVVLYVRGRLPRLDDGVSVAVAGTRKASVYGLRTASRLGSEIAACGGIVVSGLTAGIDAEAARGALRADGVCIGVLGGPIDAPFAGFLQRDVARRGAVVSEFAPGSRIGKTGYRMRNRVTAGLSLAAVVVEAPANSGALLFAGDVLAENRELFAVPGNADAINAEGTFEDLDTDDDLFAMLQHQLMVTGQVGFALYTVDDQHFCFLTRRRQQFDMCRETSATESYDTGSSDLVDDGFRLQRARTDEIRRTVDLRQPLVTLYIDEDSLSGSTPCVGPITNLSDRTTNRRADVRTYESTGFSQQFAYFHFRSDFHYSLGGCTDMLHKRDDGLLGQRALRDTLVCGELFVVMRMNSAYFKCLHNSIWSFTIYHLFDHLVILLALLRLHSGRQLSVSAVL